MQMIFARWVISLIILFSVILPMQPPSGPVPDAAVLILEGPTACPGTGCAAGQRLNLRASYDLSLFQSDTNPNVQFCVYTPTHWAANSLSIAEQGTPSGGTYSDNSSQCAAAPSGYAVLGGGSAIFENAFFGDSLNFALRLGKTAAQDGSILVRVFENNGTSWIQSEQAFILIPVAAIDSTVYVSENAGECAGFSPCFLNSKDDLPNGIGTGLKDAVDAINPGETIQILGNYPIKAQTVLINKAVNIQGSPTNRLTTNNSTCSAPMLLLTDGAAIRSLEMNDGSCTSPNRDLIQINSAADVTLEYNSFQNGKVAVRMQNNNGDLLARFNHFAANAGYAILNEAADPNTGQITAIANNFMNTVTIPQVICTNSGSVDHNYWGPSQNPAASAPDCASTEGRQLGSPILINASGLLDAKQVTVRETPASYFSSQLTLSHPADKNDIKLYIINHGNEPDTEPFTSGSGPIACSNYFTLFLDQAAPAESVFHAAVKYDANASCVSVVESETYCGSSDQGNYPLWWYDPLQNITDGWDKVGHAPTGTNANGASGQTTTCQIDNNQITVEIDASGRPGIDLDLYNLPIFTGLTGGTASISLKSFTVNGYDQKVKVNWLTSSEINTSGYYVQRSPQGKNIFTRVSAFIIHNGSESTNGTYEFIDTNVSNFTGYDYRLEIIGTNLESTYSGFISVMPMPSTLTPTVTATPTATLTLTRTITPTLTITRTRTATRTPYPSRTPTRTRAVSTSSFRTRTNTPTKFVTRTPVSGSTATPSKTPTLAGYPANQTVTITPSPDPNSAYPGAVSTTAPGSNGEGGYPAPGETQTPDAKTTIEPTQANNRGDKPTSEEEIPVESEQANKRNFAYIILGSMVGLSFLLVVAFILWKKGILPLPF